MGNSMERRDILLKAFMIMLENYENDLEFCEVLARDVGVGAVPGSAFFKEPINHLIRLHFAKSDETLNAALNRLEKMKTIIKKRS